MKWKDILFWCIIATVAFIFIAAAVFIKLGVDSEADKYTLLVTDGKSTKYTKEQFYEEYIDSLQENQDEIASGGQLGSAGDEYEEAGSVGEDEDDVFAGDAIGELAEGYAQDAMAFYKTTTLADYRGTRQVGTLTLYSSIPWSSENSYTLNVSNCIEYVQRVLGKCETTGEFAKDNRCTSEIIILSSNGTRYYYSEDTEDDSAKYYYISSAGRKIYVSSCGDAVNCVSAAGYPILAFCNVRDNGTPINWGQDTRPERFCAILQDMDGYVWYLPCTSFKGSGGDAKGHIWPGGVFQTYLNTNTNSTSNYLTFAADTQVTGEGLGEEVDVTNISSVQKMYATVYNGPKLATPVMNLEVNTVHYSELYNNEYSLIGYISWMQ